MVAALGCSRCGGRPGRRFLVPAFSGTSPRASFLMFGPKTYCVVIVGAQWGDEGKGKIVDVLAEDGNPPGPS